MGTPANRRPAGTPVGGQFAPKASPEPSVELTDTEGDPMSTWEGRVAALRPFCAYGPDYNRGVADALADHRLFAARSEVDAAEHHLLIAECRAGLFEFEEFEERDPFARQRRERSSESPPSPAQPSPLSLQRTEQSGKRYLTAARDALARAGLNPPEREVKGWTPPNVIDTTTFTLRHLGNGRAEMHLIVDGESAELEFVERVELDGDERMYLHDPVEPNAARPAIEAALRAGGIDARGVKYASHQTLWDHTVGYTAQVPVESPPEKGEV